MPGYPENTRYHLASWSGSILAIIGGSIPAIGIVLNNFSALCREGVNSYTYFCSDAVRKIIGDRGKSGQ